MSSLLVKVSMVMPKLRILKSPVVFVTGFLAKRINVCQDSDQTPFS